MRCWRQPSAPEGRSRARALAKTGAGYSGAFADPDGYVWEVAHNPDWVIAADGSVRLP